MKVKTFNCGILGGTKKTFDKLDADVAALGDIVIHSLTDTLYSDIIDVEGRDAMEKAYVRVVVYTPEKPQK